MTKKESEKKRPKSNKSVSEPDLFTIKKAKELREKFQINPTTIAINTDFSFSTVGKIENTSTTDKYNLGQINTLARLYLEKYDEQNNASLSKSDDKTLNEVPNIHSFLSPEPILAKYKIAKEIPTSVSIEKAVIELLETGYFDKDFRQVDEVKEECEKRTNKKFLRNSIRYRLNLMSGERRLTRKKMGSDNTYHYKKL